jgi:hypothetical protein
VSSPLDPVARAKAKTRANTPEATGSPEVADSTSADSGKVKPAAGAAAEVASGQSVEEPASGAGRLAALGQFRASAWKSRLVQDLIVPTVPVPAGTDEALGTMRDRLLQERRARLPELFRQPVTTSGFALEIPVEPGGATGQPGWHDLAGATVADASVHGNRAELWWPGTTAPHDATFVLRSGDGREIARVRTDGAGVPALSAAPNVAAWYWVGIERAPSGAGAEASPPAVSLDWRLLSGAPIPANWPRDARWRGGRGYRIDLPLGPAARMRPTLALALVDPDSGWALVSDIAVR